MGESGIGKLVSGDLLVECRFFCIRIGVAQADKLDSPLLGSLLNRA